mmetsp:Transcript_17342/g.28042  ORF Transcript_17342/g.28042 Transcript_17342/m.28042 type:complete len:143 (+) Transcript_17342:638-1066(+)
MYLQYKKQDKDPAMPKALGEKRICCREWMHRPSPPSSPTHSEDEGGEEDSLADVAAALLDLAANNLFFSCFCGFGFLSLFDPAPTFNLPALVILILCFFSCFCGFRFPSLFDPAPTFKPPAPAILILCFFFVFLWIQISVTI